MLVLRSSNWKFSQRQRFQTLEWIDETNSFLLTPLNSKLLFNVAQVNLDRIEE